MIPLYLPKTRTQFYRKYNKLPEFGGLKNYKRFNLNESWKIIYSLWFFVFLIFACRVSMVSFLGMFDMTRFNLAMNLKGINLPVAEKIYKPEGSYRHYIIIGLNKSGCLTVNKKYCDIENIRIEVKHFIEINPQAIALLLIDKDTKMEKVNDLLRVLREERLLKVCFMTKQKVINIKR